LLAALAAVFLAGGMLAGTQDSSSGKVSPRVLQSQQRPAARASAIRSPSLREDYLASTDLRDFVERHRGHLRSPEAAFYVAQALEECATDREIDSCSGFADEVIDPRAIFNMLSYAARWGEPHALARTLLFRDVAASKDDALGDLPWMLTSREPSIVRDVGAFLSRGESQWRYGGEPVPTAIAGFAWELAACDLDRACSPQALARVEPPELAAEALRLREGILRALREQDWRWLGLV
jgi:hypothetical protein